MTHATQLGLMNAVPQMDIPLYSTEFLSKDGIHFAVRPIQPDDERLMVDFHKRLSEQTVYLRYFGPLRYDVRIGHERLSKLCSIDFKKQIALVAICKDANGNLIPVLFWGAAIAQ